MPTLIVCLQALVTGALVGIPLSPIGLWGVKFWTERNVLGFAAIVLGGSLGDTFLVWAVMETIDWVPKYIPEFLSTLLSSPYTQSELFVLGGAIFLFLTFREPKESEKAPYTKVLVAFSAAVFSALWIDNLPTLGLLFKVLDLHAIDPGPVFLLVFLPVFLVADLAVGGLTIWSIARLKIQGTDAYGTYVTRALCVVCIGYGIVYGLYNL
jgi:hypothetical protein